MSTKDPVNNELLNFALIETKKKKQKQNLKQKRNVYSKARCNHIYHKHIIKAYEMYI